ncbi:hypothetical protein [Pseudomonas sp. Z18(2022)]|uniref:hypothetical protein n=1 Tax=Pseudomonas sp. Z18(2022) TaxID=2983410 RepID=UPI002E8136F8|nr:hypothetical protein [Pseudomonas sp. Z18(2022)]
MSSFTIEAFLYDLAYKAGHMQRFKTEAQSLFDEYFMSQQDRSDILNWEVRAMHERGVSPMLLLLCYTAVYGIEKRDEYLVKMGMTEEPAVLATSAALAHNPT